MAANREAPNIQGMPSASTSKIQNHHHILDVIIDNSSIINFIEKLKEAGLKPKEGEEIKVTLKDQRVFLVNEMIKTINYFEFGIYTLNQELFVYNKAYWGKFRQWRVYVFLRKFSSQKRSVFYKC